MKIGGYMNGLIYTQKKKKKKSLMTIGIMVEQDHEKNKKYLNKIEKYLESWIR
jgi:hypothetical protein